MYNISLCIRSLYLLEMWIKQHCRRHDYVWQQLRLMHNTQSRRRHQHQSMNEAELVPCCCCCCCYSQWTVDRLCRMSPIHAPSWVLTTNINATIVYLAGLCGLPQQPATQRGPSCPNTLPVSRKLFINNFAVWRLFPPSIAYSYCTIFNPTVYTLFATFIVIRDYSYCMDS